MSIEGWGGARLGQGGCVCRVAWVEHDWGRVGVSMEGWEEQD